MFTAIRVAQLSLSITAHDARLLNKLWESDPTVDIALAEGSWFVEVGADDEPDDEGRAAINDFLSMTFRDQGFSPGFLAIVEAAQTERYQFVRIANEVLPEHLPSSAPN